jgi:hypothetical protein
MKLTPYFLPFIALILLFIVFYLIHYLVKNKYIIECFTNDEFSHSVDLPLNTTHSCKNFCGPTARCAITGQQCLSDLDCPGCQPDFPNDNKNSKGCIPGANDGGKLTAGVTPTYSSLTSGYGTREKIITKNMYEQPLQANFGSNTWRKTFDEEEALFNKRYKANPSQYMPKYPPMYSITGEFLGDGPLPANF